MKIPYFVDLWKDAPKEDVVTKKRRILTNIEMF